MKDDNAKFDVLLNTPAQIAQQYGQWYRKLLDNPGVPWGIRIIDERVIPMRPGDLVGLIARPGGGKTSLMAYLARAESKRIIERMKNDPKNNEVVVYITWESSAEEIETFFMSDGEFSATDVAWGRVPYDVVARKLAKRASIPIWIIGHSIERAGQPMPRMTLPSVLNCIEYMERDYGKKPTLLIFDYLQLVPVEGKTDRVAQVLESPPLIKELAQRVGVPAVCGVQASREVDNRKVKVPQKHDAQWGCVSGDTFLIGDNGLNITAEEIHSAVSSGNKVRVMSLKDRMYFVFRDIIASIENEPRDTLVVEVANGHRVRVTGNHPFLTPSGWVEAENLHIGDSVAMMDLINVADSKPVWQKVSSITVGGMVTTYDFMVESDADGDENFVGNFFVLHNSSIEQAMDKLFGLWRPWTTEQPDDDPIEIAPGQFAEIKPDLLVMQMLKQRGDDGRFTWGLHFAPQYLRLEELTHGRKDDF